MLNFSVTRPHWTHVQTSYRSVTLLMSELVVGFIRIGAVIYKRSLHRSGEKFATVRNDFWRGQLSLTHWIRSDFSQVTDDTLVVSMLDWHLKGRVSNLCHGGNLFRDLPSVKEKDTPVGSISIHMQYLRDQIWDKYMPTIIQMALVLKWVELTYARYTCHGNKSKSSVLNGSLGMSNG